MKNYKKDLKEVLYIPINEGFIFKAELHRPHRRGNRETFSGQFNAGIIDSKHLHLRIMLKDNEDLNISDFTFWHITKLNNGITPNEILLLKGFVLYPFKENLFNDGIQYNFIKNLLFPLNLKRAITLLHYEKDSLIKLVSQLIVMNRFNFDINIKGTKLLWENIYGKISV